MLRRAFTLGLVAAALVPGAAGATSVDEKLKRELDAIAIAHGGCLQLGIATVSAGAFEHTTDSSARFPLHALRRPALAALALSQMEQGKLSADEVIHLDVRARMADSPHTAAHIAEGMTLLALARATVAANDQLATRLLLDKVGGVPALQAWLQQLDQRNTVANNDEESTAGGAASTFASLFLKASSKSSLSLSPSSRTQLNEWLAEASPNSWRVARSMIAKQWRPASIAPDDADLADLVVAPGKQAVVVAAWSGEGKAQPVLRQAGEAVVRWFG